MTFEHHFIVKALKKISSTFRLRSMAGVDFGKLFAKNLSWLPTGYEDIIAGKWEQQWELENSSNFEDSRDRHGHTKIKQFYKYCYAEFYSKGVKYILYGKIQGQHLFGQWYDAKDNKGYFGTFVLRIKNSNKLIGKWMGHSHENSEINAKIWEWNKVPD